MTKIGLEFLVNTGGESEGLNEAGIETFRDRPFAAVARETGQNSRDARLDPAKPVRITFDVIEMDSSMFPSIDEFRHAARLCLEKADRPNNEKERDFFRHAVKVLGEPTVRILRISDYNTKGARGPCKEGTPFYALAKSEGSSTKEDINSGGSYGIGKNAVFAISDIHTAFFSTCYKDNEGANQNLCMGKTLFISHADKDGTERRRKGYWGKINGYMPLDEADTIPDWLLREDTGTSIYSVCMRQHKIDWRYEMAAAIVINFFCAVERQEMEFEIDGDLKINRNTIQNLFRDSNILQAVKRLNLGLAFDAAKTLHTCLIDEKAENYSLHIENLGEISMRVLLRDDLGYTIGIIRNGMYITDNLANFNEPFKRFPLHRDFAIVIEPIGDKTGEWFKRLEGPKHDDLSAERISDPAQRTIGERAFEELAKQIRKKIQELAKAEPTNKMELDELNDFFASDGTRQEDEYGPETDPKALKPTAVKKAPLKRKTSATKKTEDDDVVPAPGPGDGAGEEIGDGPGIGGGTTDDIIGPDPKPRGSAQGRQVELEGERNILPQSNKATIRRIFFTAPASGKISLQIEATGLSNPERLGIITSSKGTINAGLVNIVCKKGDRVELEVEFDVKYAGPIELSALVTPDEEAA